MMVCHLKSLSAKLTGRLNPTSNNLIMGILLPGSPPVASPQRSAFPLTSIGPTLEGFGAHPNIT
jgi:hypothetical protein